MPAVWSEAKVLSHLRVGMTIAHISDRSQWPRRNITTLASRHKMLINPVTDTARLSHDVSSVQSGPVTINGVEITSPGVAPLQVPAPLQAGRIEGLLLRGDQSPLARIKDQTKKIRLALERLEVSLRAAAEEEARTRREREERERAQADVARLERELAEARKKIGKDPRGYDPKAVRDWAAEQGIKVGASGKIRADVVKRYLEREQS